MSNLSREEFCKLSNVRAAKDEELVQFAYNNLNNLPFKGTDENYERMISGMVYNPFQPSLELTRMSVRDFMLDYERFRMRDYKTPQEFVKAKEDHLKSFIGHVGEGTFMEHPLYFDYGFNTFLGKNFYSNYNLTILDVSVVRIGDGVFCGPNVSLITATHPTDPTLRGSGIECGLPITIGNNVWLGAGATILPGVTVGDGCVVGAGAVVNKNVPENSVVVGVPAKVVKTLEPRDPEFDLHAVLKKHGLEHLN
ncbi:trimeric LpxA-like protein [Scheffersomyces xylosifermentans]|uniref:trimeric LpxA-like protein n=1 Tax=Scheffersomyces xylosifermentans TaxID=1304137 RepID=UPI00315D7136